MEITQQAFALGLYQPTSTKKKAADQPNDGEPSKLTLCQMGASAGKYCWHVITVI
ncbi:hypothetical protein ABLB69_00610 [Xenorhabdus khoisanae]|uniref:hypothetical protein n=1 Tax=Xenorhabdus khoisanae TaxID=880157 RepID=UPI0032B70AF8